MSAQASAGHPLLLVIDPLARTMDGESVRITKDVLCAGASSLKICLPQSWRELQRALEHRGRRRPVVVGDDRALLRTMRILHQAGELGEAALSFVPVGPRPAVTLAGSLGIPHSAVAAARAALDGAVRELDVLLDDRGEIVVGMLRIPDCAAPPGSAHHWLERAARSVSRVARLPGPLGSGQSGGAYHPLRVEADGSLLAHPDQPVREVTVDTSAGGRAQVSIRRPQTPGTVRVQAQAITVTGSDFRYRADEAVRGPVRSRTWTVQPSAWRLTVPR